MSVDRLLGSLQDFHWDTESTPLALPRDVALSCLGYLLSVGSLRSIISRPLLIPRIVPAIHNAILCLGSLAMFLGTGWEVWRASLTSIGRAPVATVAGHQRISLQR